MLFSVDLLSPPVVEVAEKTIPPLHTSIEDLQQVLVLTSVPLATVRT